MTVTVTHPATNVGPNPRHPDRVPCPESFEAEPYEKVSQSAHEIPVLDASGQAPTWAGQLALLGVPLTRRQWDALEALPGELARNPEWDPTYERVVLEEQPVAHMVADCPVCGTPVKVDG